MRNQMLAEYSIVGQKCGLKDKDDLKNGEKFLK